MLGAIIIEGDLDRLPGIAGLPERLFILKDFQVEPDGQITSQDNRDTRLSRFTVNGQYQPRVNIRPGEVQRWRFLNASVAASYRLALDGHVLHQIAYDGNTFSEVVAKSEILIPPAGRAEALVVGGPEGKYLLRTLDFASGQDRTTTPQVALARVVSGGSPVATPLLPAALLPAPDFRQDRIAQRRSIVLGSFLDPNSGLFTGFLINGKPFDPERIDLVAELNTTEEWSIRAATPMHHPLHIHVHPFQVVAVNGVPVEEKSLRDTIGVFASLGPDLTTTIRIRFRDFPGRTVFHCHIASHSDVGMMAVFDVVDQKGSNNTSA